MSRTSISNPFAGAPIYHLRSVASTMPLAQRHAEDGAPEGTLVVADFQRAGRGRVAGRVWRARRGAALLCTVVLRQQGTVPATLPLRCGLALVRMLEKCYGLRCHIKWPNDVVLDGGKLAGILCSHLVDGRKSGFQLAGFGINCRQRRFPAALCGRATSLRMAGGVSVPPLALLQPLLYSLQEELTRDDWGMRLREYLWRRDEWVRFVPAGQVSIIHGRLIGVGEDGAVRIQQDGRDSIAEFYAGELLIDR